MVEFVSNQTVKPPPSPLFQAFGVRGIRSRPSALTMVEMSPDFPRTGSAQTVSPSDRRCTRIKSSRPGVEARFRDRVA